MGNSSSQLVDKLTSFGNKTKKYVDIAYLGALFIFIAFYACTLTRSMPPFLNVLYVISTFILMIVAIYRLLVGKCKYLANGLFAIVFIFAAIIMVLTYFLSILSGFINLTLILFALIGAMGANGDYVLGSAICGNLVMILNNALTSLFAEPGLFINDYQDRDFLYFGDNVFYVSKLNNFSSTDLGAHYYWIVIAYLWIRGRKITWGEILALCALNCFVYSLCASTTTLLCISLAVILAVIMKIWPYFENRIGDNKIVQTLQSLIGYLAKFSFVLFAAICIYGAVAYSVTDPITSKLNQLFHFRLSLGHRGIIEYGIHLFDSNAPSYGMSSSLDGFYNFLDCSYISLLIRQGVIMLVLYVGCMTFIQLRNKKYIYGAALIAVCALACIEEHHLSELPYNIFMLLACADINSDNKIKQPVKEKKKTETVIKFVSYPLCAALLISAVCINIPRYQSIKDLDRMDDTASKIYLSVQSNIDSHVANNTWQHDISSMNSKEYGDMLDHPSDFESITGMKWEEATKDPKSHSYYSLYYDPQNTDSSKEIVSLLISSETKDLIGQGSVVIEYDVVSGEVYAVWYSESDNCAAISNGRRKDRLNRLRPDVELEGYYTGN